MNRSKWFISLFLMTFTSVFHESFACRYTVREIGFSDIGLKTYRLIFFTDSHTPEEQELTIFNYSKMLLRDSNVGLEIINVDKNKSSDALRFLTIHNIHSFPSAVFVSPGGESILCPYKYAGQSLASSSLFLLETLVSSKLREEIVNKIIRTYCVILIIEGTDVTENKRVKDAAREAVKTISGYLNQMPKAVNEEPEIMVIPYNKTDEEKMLLFGLGITGKNKDVAHLAILYGRGRLAGPILTGDLIKTRRIYNLLTLVGADCECGIDNSWIIGETIPLRWGPSEQAELINHLGFDVENPFVKTEMSQIISLKPIVGNPINPLEENLLGFVEGSFEMVNTVDAVPKITAAEIQKSFSQENQPKSNLILKTTLISLGVIFLIIVITVLSIFLLHKRRAKRN